MLVTWKALNGTNRRTEQCNQGAERNRQRLEAEEEREFTERAFSAYGRPLEMVTYFRYLGRVILAADNNWPEVVKKLSRSRDICRRMVRILCREGASLRVSGFFLKTVI